MNADVSTKISGACMGLSGFSVAIVAGLIAKNPTDVILLRAIVALFVCHVVGLLMGSFMQRVIREYLKAYEPQPPKDGGRGANAAPVAAPGQTDDDGVLVV